MATVARWVASLLAALVVLVLVPGVCVAASGGETAPTGDAGEVRLILFHGEGCPHCAAEIAYLSEELVPAYPDLQVLTYEVYGDEANRALMAQAGQAYGFTPGAVPTTIVEGPTGAQVFVGFGAGSGPAIEAAVAREVAALADAATGSPEPVAPVAPVEPVDPAGSATSVVDVPLLGRVDLAGQSVLLATLVIGFVDGVNPCSLWVLSVLLAIVLHSGSRGRVALVGGVFLAVTAGMYAVYVAGVYSVLSVLDGLVWIRVVVAAVALTFGVLQLRDGLRPDRAPTLSISPERRPGLYQRMRAVGTGERGVVATVAGTVVLAVGVSLLETPCTAGLPLLWANLLSEAGVPTGTAVALFAVYMAVFLLDELLVFAVALVTLRSMKLQQHHGQVLKIMAGSVLVTLAAAMIALPEAMRSVGGTLAVFGVALLLGLVMWLVAGAAGGRDRQVRTQRVSSVPSSARTIEDSEKPTAGSAGGPTVMRGP